FADYFFLHESEQQRIPGQHEYESFDQFVDIIKKGLCKHGQVSILSCSSTAPINQEGENFSQALAQKLPGIKVTGTTTPFVPFNFYLTSIVTFTPWSISI